jgi:hypothetical protein
VQWRILLKKISIETRRLPLLRRCSNTRVQLDLSLKSLQSLCMHTLTLFSCAWCAYAANNWIKLDRAAHLILFAPGTEWGLCAAQTCECGRFFVVNICGCVRTCAAACCNRRALSADAFCTSILGVWNCIFQLARNAAKGLFLRL